MSSCHVNSTHRQTNYPLSRWNSANSSMNLLYSGVLSMSLSSLTFGRLPPRYPPMLISSEDDPVDIPEISLSTFFLFLGWLINQSGEKHFHGDGLGP
jgi:hypothetical protein